VVDVFILVFRLRKDDGLFLLVINMYVLKPVTTRRSAFFT